MKKSLSAAIISSLLVVSSACPAFAAVKNIYTDADSGFSVQTVKPVFEYASRHSYGYQEDKSVTDSFVSLAAIPADVVEKKTGVKFTTKDFMKHLTVEMDKKAAVKSDYVLFQPETYLYPESEQPEPDMEKALFQVFNKETFEDGIFSYETKTVGKQDYYVISVKYPGAFDKEKDIDKNASDMKIYLTSANDILYLAQSYCNAETEASKKARETEEGKNKEAELKKNYEEKGVSMETAGEALQNPQALQKALLPLSDSSLNDPKFQKALEKERNTILKGITFFKPAKREASFGIVDPVLKQTLPLPDDWLYLKLNPDIKNREGLKVNVAVALPYLTVSKVGAMAAANTITRELKPEEVYNLYDESLILASYSLRKNNKNKEITEFADEIFSIPQAEMQKAVDEMMPKLLADEDIKKYAVLDNAKATITNDGQTIRFNFDSNVKVMNQFDFLTRATLAGTRENGLLGLFIAKGDKAKTKSVMDLADTVKLLPEK